MSNPKLLSYKAAFIAESGFCEREFNQAEHALTALGVDCRVISAASDIIKGWREEKKPSQNKWGKQYAVHETLKDCTPADYDILVLTGGKMNVNKLKLEARLKPFISSFLTTNKPVIAYNQSVDLLMFHKLIDGYSVAAKDQICDQLDSVGGRCAASEFVVSKNLITLSRYRDVEQQIQQAVIAILNNEPYVEQVGTQDSLPKSYNTA